MVDGENRGLVAADRHERAVPERDLPAVAGEDCEPEQRDEVDADRRELARVEVADLMRDEPHDHGERDERERFEDELRARHQTRLAATRPKRPPGRTTSNPRISSSATGSFRVWPTYPTKGPTSVITRPSSSPPTTAPTGLSRPPRTAAANAYRRITCIMFGPSDSIGAISSPAIAPTTAASPQPSANIHPTRTPTRRDDAALSAEARSASPTFVNRKNKASRTTSTASMPIIPMYWTLMCAPANLIVRVEKPPSKVRSPPPQMTLIRPFSTSARPSVTITDVTTGPRSKGRITVRSIAIPPTNAIAMTIGNASQNVSPWFINDHAMNVVNVAISPWAKLIVPVVR